jgi:hypothetical protein
MFLRKLSQAAGLFAALALSVSLASAADHKDAPLIDEDKALDLLDVFAFVSPTNNDQIVLALTMNGFTVPGELGIGFATNALYEVKIDNTGDFREDLVIQFTFDKIGAAQMMTVRGPAAPIRRGATSKLLPNSEILLTGAANGTELTSGDVKAFAGLRDDPFFTDLIWVVRQTGIVAGGPLARANGIDFLAGLNASIIAVQVPRDSIKGDTNNINVWGTTSRPLIVRNHLKQDPTADRPLFVQIDRTAAPVANTLINSALTNNAAAKDRFNRTAPENDVARFRDVAIAAIVALGALDSDEAGDLVDAVFIPDVLHLDVTNSAGFPNGRRPEDDVVDVILNAGSAGGLTNDGVDDNDVAFPNAFPFFAAPHSAAEGVPARDQ